MTMRRNRDQLPMLRASAGYEWRRERGLQTLSDAVFEYRQTHYVQGDYPVPLPTDTGFPSRVWH